MPKLKRQDPPNCIQLEIVEGCSLACSFCGVQGIRPKKGSYKYMKDDTLQQFLRKLAYAKEKHNWNPRIELAMHGEPTVHPRIVQICDDITNEVEPRELIVVSNGTKFAARPQLADELSDVGVTSICLDQYEGCDFVPKFVDGYTGDIPIYTFPEQKFRSTREKGCFIVIKDDVTNLTTPYDKPNTHCGAGGEPEENNPALNKRCAKPFRELSIRWDGNVALCCNDFRGVYKIGSIFHFRTLDSLWNHPRFEAARRVLYHNSRDFHPCKYCDALSPRVGLLPDKKGKQEMPPPDSDTFKEISVSTGGDPYTEPVLRGWESRKEACLPPHVDLVQLDVQNLDK